MPIALDYTSRISPAALKAADVTMVCRYLSWLYWWSGQTHTTINPKIIQRQEYDELVAAGIDVVLNWEYDPHDYRGGAAAGADHAREAVNQARALGYPTGSVIIGSADADVSRDDWLGTGRAYYSAFATNLRISGYRSGIYGPYDVLTWARDDNVADVFWQAGMSTSWSGSRNAKPWPGAHLRQRGTKTVAGQVADWSDILGRLNVAAGDADKAFSEPYTGTEPFVRGDSWMAKAVETPINKANATLESLQRDVQSISVPVALSTTDRAAIVADLAVQLGGKLDAILARLDAVGHALNG